MQLAIEYMKMGKLASSRDYMERALSDDPGNPDVQMTAGMVYERLLDMRKAGAGPMRPAYRLGKGDPNIQKHLRRIPVPYRQGPSRAEKTLR